MDTDEELVRKTLAGDTHHYGVIIQRHADFLFGLGMRLTLGNKELAEDISQQAFLKSFSYLKSYDPEKPFKHWLTGIAVNCFKDLNKKEQRFESSDEHSLAYTPQLEGNSDFFRLIKPLSEEEKILFTLRYIYEYQTNEIAELLNLNPGTVKSKLSRAMEKLR